MKWAPSIGDATGDQVALVDYKDDQFAPIRAMCKEPELKDFCPKT